jgi:hypothetical protein
VQLIERVPERTIFTRFIPQRILRIRPADGAPITQSGLT